LLIPCRSQPQ